MAVAQSPAKAACNVVVKPPSVPGIAQYTDSGPAHRLLPTSFSNSPTTENHVASASSAAVPNSSCYRGIAVLVEPTKPCPSSLLPDRSPPVRLSIPPRCSCRTACCIPALGFIVKTAALLPILPEFSTFCLPRHLSSPDRSFRFPRLLRELGHRPSAGHAIDLLATHRTQPQPSAPFAILQLEAQHLFRAVIHYFHHSSICSGLAPAFTAWVGLLTRAKNKEPCAWSLIFQKPPGAGLVSLTMACSRYLVFSYRPDPNLALRVRQSRVPESFPSASAGKSPPHILTSTPGHSAPPRLLVR